ncbi:MAG TPA: Asp23/Gls24 family envelope stress response protein [Ktedonobacterales bacterium]|jgi:uncharacterized alkaline shock family protein YloU|nr:Asp23/Gls24 family envelope stress response protein [Ktedonobacterales bacterium]
MYTSHSISTPASSASWDRVSDDARLSADAFGGRVRIAPRALRTVVCEAALAVPGVARLYTRGHGWAATLGRPFPREGIALTVRQHAVGVDLYVVVVSGANMVSVGESIQEAVGAAIEHILGMDVSEINVYVRDVS